MINSTNALEKGMNPLLPVLIENTMNYAEKKTIFDLEFFLLIFFPPNYPLSASNIQFLTGFTLRSSLFLHIQHCLLSDSNGCFWLGMNAPILFPERRNRKLEFKRGGKHSE